MNNGLDNKEMPASSGGEDAVPVVIQNGSTKNLEAALVAIGNAGFGDRSGFGKLDRELRWT